MDKTFNSKRLLNKKKKMKKWKYWVFSIFFAVLLFGFVYWMRDPVFNVSKIEILKNHFSKTEKIQASVISALDGNMFLFIPKTNALILPRSETEKKIKEEYPEIESVDINLKGLNDIEVEISEYEPKLIWSNKNGDKYFVNKEGKTFLKEPVLHSYDNLIKIETNQEVSDLGVSVIDPNFLSNLDTFVNKLKEIDVVVDRVVHSGEDVYYLNVKKSFKILISSQDDLSLSFENIQTILEGGALDKEKLNLIDYIDLRFGNKVFYKFKE